MALTVAAMKTVGDIRRANLELLVDQVKKLEAVAEAVGTTSVYLSQIRNRAKDVKTGKPREMGAKMARRIEEAMNKPPGWFDVDHSGEVAPAAVAAPPKPLAHQSFDEMLVNRLADRLLALPAEVADRSVDACRRLAESPDSRRSRDALVDLIAFAPDSSPAYFAQAASSKDWQLPPAVGMLADRWTIPGEREVIQRFLETLTQFMAESRVSPESGHAAASAAQDRKAATREN